MPRAACLGGEERWERQQREEELPRPCCPLPWRAPRAWPLSRSSPAAAAAAAAEFVGWKERERESAKRSRSKKVSFFFCFAEFFESNERALVAFAVGFFQFSTTSLCGGFFLRQECMELKPCFSLPRRPEREREREQEQERDKARRKRKRVWHWPRPLSPSSSPRRRQPRRFR